MKHTPNSYKWYKATKKSGVFLPRLAEPQLPALVTWTIFHLFSQPLSFSSCGIMEQVKEPMFYRLKKMSLCSLSMLEI